MRLKRITALITAAAAAFTVQINCLGAENTAGELLFEERFEEGLDSWTVQDNDKCVIADDEGNNAFSLTAALGQSVIGVNNEFYGSDYRVSARIKPEQTLQYFSGGIVFMYEDENNYLMFRFAGTRSSDRGYELYKWENGSASMIAEKKLHNYSVGEWHDVSIDIIDGCISVDVDGSSVFDGVYAGRKPSAGGIGARVYAGQILVDDISVCSISYPQDSVFIESAAAAELEPTENWIECEGKDYDGGSVYASETKNSTAVWGGYPYELEAGESAVYTVYTWIPEASGAFAEFTITTAAGVWTRRIDQSAGGWIRLAAVEAVGETAMTVKLRTTENKKTYAASIRFIKGISQADEPDSVSSETDTETIAIFLNQSGFDTESAKRATVTNVEDGSAFSVIEKESGETVYSGTVIGSVADFSELMPEGAKEYYLVCSGAQSYNFTIAKNYNERISVPVALDFMEQSRCDKWERGRKGIGWRDSHQFSFEMNSLVLQYMSNPALYENLPYDVYRVEDTEFETLRSQNEPNIVWLMKFAAEVYYKNHVIDGYNLHPLIKEQMAYFLYLYPYISDYVSYEDYIRFRDMTVDVWGDADDTNAVVYYNVPGEQYNLFEVQTTFGNIKGSYPPGHSVLPNLLMYEVAKRDGLDDAERYFEAAYNNCEYLINEIDITDPVYSKGQRMSERVLMEGLAYFEMMYPDRAPEGLGETIEYWTSKMIARSDNQWDMRMASSVMAGDDKDYWTGAAFALDTGQSTTLMNEPGCEIGFQAAAYAAAMAIDDEERAERLMEIGDAGRDNMFGRNPQGMMYFHDAVTDIEGADLGWPSKFPEVGNGVLGEVRGRIDASPKEAAYPFNPDADYGYVEGWGAYNTAWNEAIAYSSAENIDVEIDRTSAEPGESVKVRLRAPVNIDYENQETAFVYVNDGTGKRTKLTLREETKDSYYFTGEYIVPEGVSSIVFSYGIGHFEKSQVLNVTENTVVSIGGIKEENGEVSAHLEGSADNVVITAAAYNGGELVEVKTSVVNISGAYDFSEIFRSNHDTIKLFVWNDKMKPYTNTETIINE